MTNKSLKNKAISIKGKQYVLVSDRVLFFNENYPEGYITTKLLSEPSAEMVVIRATVHVGDRKFTGHSQAVWGEGMVNKTAALENAETSAVGRALAMMGIGVIDSIASGDEVNKAVSDRRNDPIMDATQDFDIPTKCAECGASGKYHKPGCKNA